MVLRCMQVGIIYLHTVSHTQPRVVRYEHLLKYEMHGNQDQDNIQMIKGFTNSATNSEDINILGKSFSVQCIILCNIEGTQREKEST